MNGVARLEIYVCGIARRLIIRPAITALTPRINAGIQNAAVFGLSDAHELSGIATP